MQGLITALSALPRLLRENYCSRSRQQMAPFQHGDVRPLMAAVPAGFVGRRVLSPGACAGVGDLPGLLRMMWDIQPCSSPEHHSQIGFFWLLQFIVISSLLEQPPLVLFGYQYPAWSTSVGHLVGASSFICIPVYMVYKLVWTPGSLKQVRATSAWPWGQDAVPRCLPFRGTPPAWDHGGWQEHKRAVQGTRSCCGKETRSLFSLPSSTLQRLAVCVRPEKTARDAQAEALRMSPVP